MMGKTTSIMRKKQTNAVVFHTIGKPGTHPGHRAGLSTMLSLARSYYPLPGESDERVLDGWEYLAEAQPD